MPAKFTNNASGTLASSIASGVTTIAVTTGQGALFPTLAAGEFFYATLANSSNQLEIVRVTARSGDTLTVVRGQEGTTARAYNAADKIELRPTAAGLNNMAQLDATQTFTGANTFSGANSFSGTNTVSGTLTSSAGTFSGSWAGTATFSGNITFSNTITGSVSGNAGTVTDGVYLAGAQTITGVKTFTAAVAVAAEINIGYGTAGEKVLRLQNNVRNCYLYNNATGLVGIWDMTLAANRWSSDLSGNFTAAGSVKASATGVIFPDNTTQTTAAVTGVTSLTAGNGIAVSASTGAVTVSQDIYSGTTSTNSTFPIGSYVYTDAGSSGVLNGSVTIYVLSSGNQFRGSLSGGFTGSALAGTWRVRGTRSGSCCFYAWALAQRVA